MTHPAKHAKERRILRPLRWLLLGIGLLQVFAATTQAETLRIGYRLDSAPLQFQDEQGEARGILIDFWKLWSEKSGIPVRFEGAYNKPLQQKLVNGDVDIIAGLFANDERRQRMLFSAEILSSPYHLYVAASLGEDFSLAHAGQIQNFHIGVTRGSFHDNYLKTHHPDLSPLRFKGYEDLFEAADQGQIEAFIAQPMYLAHYRQRHPGNGGLVAVQPALYTHAYRAAVSKQNANLLAQINRYIGQISGAEKSAIASKWLGIRWGQSTPATGQLSLSALEQQWLSEHRQLRIGVDPDWPPIEYVDHNQTYSGIASDYVNLIERKLNIDMAANTERSWAQSIELIKQGKLDVLPAVSRTREREAYLNFTRPYLKFPYVIFTRDDAPLITGLEELIGKTVVVEEEYANHNLLRDNHPGIQLMRVATTEQALRAVSLGQADAYMGNLAASSHILLEAGIANLKVAAPTPYSNDLCFAVRKDMPELVGILQKALDTVTVKQANAIKRKWFSVRFEHDLDYGLLWKVIGTSLLVLVLAALWIWMIMRQKEALRVSEERFQLVMNAAQEGIWDWNLETGHVYFSPGIYKILGYDEAELPGDYAGLTELLPDQDRDRILDEINKIITDCRASYSLEFPMITPSGRSICLLARGTLDFDRYGKPVRSLGSLSDITEKKSAEQKLEQNERQLKSIIDAIPLAIIVVEDDGTIVYANKETEKDASPGKSAVGLNMLSFYEHPEDRDRLYSIYREQGRVDAMPMRYRTPSGKVIEGIISMLPVYFNDGIKNLGVLVDLTDRIRMERELLAAKIQAEAANKTKSSFLANMSHEIRTPMNAIIGLGHLVSKTELHPRQQDYIDKINQSAHSLLGIINDILDFSKIEAGKLEIEKTEFALEDVMANLSSMIALRAEEKGLEIAYSIDPNLPHRLLGDPLRLGQILINLTQNAIKFSEQGVVMVKVNILENSKRQVRLGFSVEDEGIGIAEEQLSTLFEAFSQADDSHTRRYGGTGLGLAICKQLVHLMGGQISVRSESGKGSVFSFQLPFDVANELQQTVTQPIDFTGQRALIIDDNGTARQILSSMLASFHFDIETADSGRKALTLIEQRYREHDEKPYELILVDWKMPEMNGIQTVQHIRQTLPQEKTPVIIMITAYGREEIMHQADQAGLDGFLIKPINSSILYNSILESMYQTEPGQQTIPVSVPVQEKLSAQVLLVEDNSINQQVAEEILQNMGLDVAVAGDGKQALELMRQQAFDLVLTDIQMPVMDGYELTAAIRNDASLASIPIIAMTAHAMEGDRERSLQSGMDDHVAKPIDPGHLYFTLKHWLGRPVKHQPATSGIRADADLFPEHIQGIDINSGLRRIGGNKQLFMKLLREFAEDYSHADDELRAAMTSGDLDEARPMLHTIQGISGNIGATRLHDAAMSVRECLKQHLLDELSDCADEFYAAFDEVKQALQACMARCQNNERETGEGAIRLNRSVLQTIEELLEQGNPDAARLLSSIDQNRLDADVVDLIQIALDNVNNYDFNHAQAIVSRIDARVNKGM